MSLKNKKGKSYYNKEYQRKWREEHPGYGKEYRKNIGGRKVNNMSLNKSIEFLEKLKDKNGIDVEVVNQMQRKVKTLDEALLLDLEKLAKGLYKPIRKVGYIAMKSKNPENIETFFEEINKVIAKAGTAFPEAKITISFIREY